MDKTLIMYQAGTRTSYIWTAALDPHRRFWMLSIPSFITPQKGMEGPGEERILGSLGIKMCFGEAICGMEVQSPWEMVLLPPLLGY